MSIPPAHEYNAAIVALATEEGWQKIGFEAPEISFSNYDKLRSAGENIFTLQPFESSIIEILRYVKQPQEIVLLRKCY